MPLERFLNYMKTTTKQKKVFNTVIIEHLNLPCNLYYLTKFHNYCVKCYFWFCSCVVHSKTFIILIKYFFILEEIFFFGYFAMSVTKAVQKRFSTFEHTKSLQRCASLHMNNYVRHYLKRNLYQH